MTNFDGMCESAGGKQVGLNSDWCVSMFFFGKTREGYDVLVGDREDGTCNVRIWDERAYAESGMGEDGFRLACRKEAQFPMSNLDHAINCAKAWSATR